MNCKTGDLAIVTRSRNGNNGKIVTCLRLATMEEKPFGSEKDAVWITDNIISWSQSGECYRARDSVLTPLRGDLTTDTIETQIKEIA